MRNKIVQYGLAGLALLIALLSVRGAWHNGQARAKSMVTLADAAQVNTALGYFFSDQGRYPSTLEFSSQDSFGVYLNPFPPRQLTASECPSTLQYRNPNSSQYALYACLAKSANGRPAGWSQVAGNAISSR
jgi:hypothetical protein